jgi:hypothetical protein
MYTIAADVKACGGLKTIKFQPWGSQDHDDFSALYRYPALQINQSTLEFLKLSVGKEWEGTIGDRPIGSFSGALNPKISQITELVMMGFPRDFVDIWAEDYL